MTDGTQEFMRTIDPFDANNPVHKKYSPTHDKLYGKERETEIPELTAEALPQEEVETGKRQRTAALKKKRRGRASTILSGSEEPLGGG